MRIGCLIRYIQLELRCVGNVASKARGEYLRTHFKNMREVAAALTGKGVFSVHDLQLSVSIRHETQ